MDAVSDLLASSQMHEAEAIRRAWWIAELPDFDPSATEMVTNLAEDGGDT